MVIAHQIKLRREMMRSATDEVVQVMVLHNNVGEVRVAVERVWDAVLHAIIKEFPQGSLTLEVSEVAEP